MRWIFRFVCATRIGGLKGWRVGGRIEGKGSCQDDVDGYMQLAPSNEMLSRSHVAAGGDGSQGGWRGNKLSWH